MSPKITRIRRGEGEAPDASARPTAPAEGSPAPRVAAPQPSPPVRAPRLDAGDLEALASMDRDALDALMGASTSRLRLAEGDKVTGTLARIGREMAFVELGAKAEALMDLSELRGEQIGDPITAFVLSTSEDGVRISRQLGGDAAAAFIDEAAASGVPVEGRVTGRNPGGYEVRIGTVRAFVPVSHMDRNAPADPDAYIGQTFTFQVLEAGKEPVLSRRALLEEQAKEARDVFYAKVRPGDAFTGVVTSIQPFGVFVDIGGVDGLVHKSELGWGASGDPSAHVTRGQRLEVRVLEVDAENRKLSLSAKDPSASPWGMVGSEFVAGGTYEGTVTGVEKYGAFVQLATGLQGLLHTSRRAGGKLLRVGESLSVRIVGIDHERRRLELADPTWEGAGAPASEEDEAWRTHRAKRTDEGSLGTLGDLLKGLRIDR